MPKNGQISQKWQKWAYWLEGNLLKNKEIWVSKVISGLVEHRQKGKKLK